MEDKIELYAMIFIFTLIIGWPIILTSIVTWTIATVKHGFHIWVWSYPEPMKIIIPHLISLSVTGLWMWFLNRRNLL